MKTLKAEKKSASEDWRTYIYNSVNAFQEYKKNDDSLIIGFNTLQKSNSDLLIRLLHKRRCVTYTKLCLIHTTK